MPDNTLPRVGFIGLGLMGRPMCRHLIEAGYPVSVHNRSPGPVEALVEGGADAPGSAAAVAAVADIVILMLPDTPTVEAVLTGDDSGILSALRPGTLVIDMGTTAADATRRFAAAVRERGGDYVDAPVSGGTVGAEQATLTVMCGGSEDAVTRAHPILTTMSGAITHVGDVGAGQVAKAANQVIVGLTIGAVAEALALARAAGVDPGRVRAALRGGFADSRILEVHGKRMVDGDFRPGGKCTTQRKDLTQALTLAGQCGLDMPATRLNRELYDRAIAAGDGDLDHSALYRLYGDR